MKITRRELGAALTAAPLAAQPSLPKPAEEDLLRQARENRRRAAERLAQYKLPMDVEPAFRFQP